MNYGEIEVGDGYEWFFSGGDGRIAIYCDTVESTKEIKPKPHRALTFCLND